jgi:hypothetical protein
VPWPRPTRRWRKRSESSGPAGPCRHKQESSELLAGKHLNHLSRTGAQRVAGAVHFEAARRARLRSGFRENPT